MADKLKNIEKHHSPNYFVKKRLERNKPALIGLVIIVLAALVALFGYLIMPDETPNANDGAVQIQQKHPGFSTQILKIRKNTKVEQNSLFQHAFFGQESAYTIEPIESYRVEGFDLYVTPYGHQQEKQYFLPEVVKTFYIGDTAVADLNNNKMKISGDTLQYLDLKGNLKTITQAALLAEFENKNLETRTYWLGTDKSGRDMLSRLIFGTRISLSIGFVAVLISMFLGISLGAIAGFFGGKLDSFIVWLMSVVWSIPGIMLVIAISIALQSRGVWVAFIAVGLTMWVEVARVTRGQIMSIKEKLYVESARAFGLSNFRIVFNHILPNILGPLIVIATSNFAAAILLEAGLSFLGLSVQPPTPSWGIMIFEGYNSIITDNSWHLVIFPALAICLMVLSFNILGNGLRDAFDPKTIITK